MAFGSPAGRRRGNGRPGAGSARSTGGSARPGVGSARSGVGSARSAAGSARSAAGRVRARSGALRNGSRPNSTLWLPITAAAGVLLLLLWYAMSQSPSGKSDAAAPVATALGRAGASGAAALAALPTVPAPPASGCQTGKSLPSGVTTETVTVAGTDRQYRLAVPQGARAGTALPLVVNLHDRDQSVDQLEQYTGMADAGTRSGYAVVTPVGVSARWNLTRSAEVGPDDVLFIGTVLNDLTGRMCLDSKRVFASGFSDGADMVLELACALPDRFAAVVTVAASRIPDDCADPRANLLEMHGTADAIAPWDGGGPARTAPFVGLVAQPVESRTDRYARAFGCGGEHSAGAEMSSAALTAWTSCPTGKDVGVLAIKGGGHTWPGAAARPELGATVSSLSATVVALEFFGGHPADGRTVTGGGASGGGGTAGGGATRPAAPTTSPAPASATRSAGPEPSVSAVPDSTTEPTTGPTPSPTPVVPSVSATASASPAAAGG
ncbi:plasmid partitioning protein [Frankia sp. CH37]|nr:plasmid partitioning protein [Parafrankia sp. CH37]